MNDHHRYRVGYWIGDQRQQVVVRASSYAEARERVQSRYPNAIVRDAELMLKRRQT